jgi:spermidine synthase
MIIGGKRSSEEFPYKNSSSLSIRLLIYLFFFLSGAASLIYQILWTRQFIPVFGNSSYAITVVLVAFMAGLGLGSWFFGRYADRHRNRLLLYSIIEAGVALSAFIIPLILSLLKKIMPIFFSSLAESILLISIIRFTFSFMILFLPSFLMGGTLPVLSRYCIDELKFVSHRLSLLYGLNTLGAAAGVFSAGFFLIETFGLSGTNSVAIALNLFIAGTMFFIWFLREKKGEKVHLKEKEPAKKKNLEKEPSLGQTDLGGLRPVILSIAIITGFTSLSLEILWTRYMFFRIPSTPYSFSSILGVFLICLGIGSLLYRLLFASRKNQVLILAFILILIGPLILIMLHVASKLAISYGLRFLPFFSINPSSFLWEKVQSINIAAVTIFVPAVFIGITFPILCKIFTQNIKKVGGSIGKLYAVNTVGSIAGSFLPVFVLIPLLGIRLSFLLTALFISGAGLGLIFILKKGPKTIRLVQAFASLFILFFLFSLLIPKDLSKELFLSTLDLGKHNDIIFYEEGKTGTSILVQDKVSRLKDLYINSVEEVPTSYAAQYCFKLMGILGVLLHPEPSETLMICFGGGIAAGTAIQHPEVKSLEVVDIEASVVKAAHFFSQENNNLLKSDKVRVIIEDGRNYLFMTGRKYPLIISDSTHPKSADSWVLYTQEFYKAVEDTLTEDGVFVQWLPFHLLTTQEYQIILKTFQSVFPHTTLWLTHSFDEMGRYMKFSLVVGTPEPFSLDFQSFKRKLLYPSVQEDLEFWNLNHPLGILENFLSGEKKIREWTESVPINTDNLPWSYYNTKYSRGEKHSLPGFIPIAESIWPYLKNTGNKDERDKLEKQLNLLFQRKKLFLQFRFKEALSLLPQDKKALKEKENIELSMEYLKEVSKFYPRDSKRLLWLARGLRRLLNIQGDKPEEREEVINMLQKAVEADSQFSESHLELADILLEGGKRDQAVLHYKKVLELKPDSFLAHMMLGNILSEEGKALEAMEHFLQAIKIDSLNSSARNNLATVLILQKRIDEAIHHLREALRIDPKNAEIQNNLGAALLEKGKIEEAKVQFEEALRIQPDYWKAKANLANVLAQKGELEEAIVLSYEVLRKNPGDIQNRYILSIYLLRKYRYAEAKQILQEGLKLLPDNLAILNLLAKLLISVPDPKLLDRKQALILARHACDITEEKNPECLDILASAYATLGKFKEAAEIARKAYNLALSLNLKQLAEDIKKRLDTFESLH